MSIITPTTKQGWNIKSLFRKNGTNLKILAILAGVGALVSYFSFAGTPPHYSYSNTDLTFNGSQVSAPKHIAANDPFAGASAGETSFLPIFYTDGLLQKAGIIPSWDGSTLNLQVPSSIKVNYPTTPSSMTLSDNVMAIEINGKIVSYAPKIAYNDAGTTTATTFVPVYYLQKTFSYLGFQTAWNGTTWSVDAPGVQVGQTYPDGWTAPTLTTSWSPALAANNDAGALKLFQDELGFTDGGTSYDIPHGPNTIGISNSTGGQYEVSISWLGWGPDHYDPSWDPNFPQMYRIPIISKDLFDFYFGSDAQKVYNYFASNNIPDTFTANGRQCRSLSSSVDGSVTLVIGYKQS